MVHNVNVHDVMIAINEEFKKCCQIDEINKIYRQARIWVRYNFVISGVDKEGAKEVNDGIKNMRWNRMKELGYRVPDKFEGKDYD